ncbi:hypothetical protein BBK36DRAFT_1144110 [Trichoderma citrinoviride]|uniref:Aminoglycoside phosphotransferase domain-containing protein n=1 Tax=Trichoderma citrinoviride TaxID=58853 RepID=A0A2T4B147_9HYPO|nr:hypothetical protein BBK36DRAFT_1144110 [Trichoderma citrinoviride]PTB63046.1 hypothetical protein BBK36DRAFT_1144110 [Trichoderma citrinoviride]
MADAGADSLRLSPVFDRPRDNPLNKMEGLNPERAMRLLQSRSPEKSLSPVITIGPRITGSNAVGLGVATTRQLTGVKRERSPSRDGEARSLAQVPRTASQSLPLVIAGVKRRRSHLDEPEPRSTRQWCSVPPVLPPQPPPNPHTIYLESLLAPRSLLLTLKSRRGDGSQIISTQYRSTTNVGLLLGNAIQDRLDIPVLQLPAPSQAEGSLERVIQGELLEAVWFDLTPEAKYAYARQLRRIVNNMRSGMTSVRNPPTTVARTNVLGSAFSGPYSLMLDQHVQNTYWAVRTRPTCHEYVAFLATSFVPSVPTPVAHALTCQFRTDYRIRFTHGELSPGNIVVHNSKIVCILGWDNGGWYPEWWEYAKFFEARTSPENQDWYDYANEIFLDAYPNELVAYQGIARCQRQ